MALWPYLAPPWPTKTMPCAPVMQPWPCRRRCGAMPKKRAAPMASRSRCAWASIPAVVVRAIGNDLHMEYSAVGQATHLAARMEQLATPGSIFLTATTLRLVAGLVQVTALGLVPVKGLEEPIEVF